MLSVTNAFSCVAFNTPICVSSSPPTSVVVRPFSCALVNERTCANDKALMLAGTRSFSIVVVKPAIWDVVNAAMSVVVSDVKSLVLIASA